MSTFADNLSLVEIKIQQACAQVGRSADSVKLVAVSKTVSAADIHQAAATTPQRAFGENRADALQSKAQSLSVDKIDINWHFIGNIQTNKLKQIVPLASLIHSVSTIRAISAISQLCQKLNQQQDILLEINTSGEISKTGAQATDLPALIEACNQQSQHIRLCGLMTMAPPLSAAISNYEISQAFAKLRKLLDSSSQYLNSDHKTNFAELSMGMSGDYELAIAQGSTIVRIGTALWG